MHSTLLLLLLLYINEHTSTLTQYINIVKYMYGI